MAKVVGYINLHSDISYKGLTEKRPVASVSFLGRYGIIDFVLSNMSNSNVDTVGILIKEKPRSLFKHLGNGNSWILTLNLVEFHFYTMKSMQIVQCIIKILIILWKILHSLKNQKQIML